MSETPQPSEQPRPPHHEHWLALEHAVEYADSTVAGDKRWTMLILDSLLEQGYVVAAAPDPVDSPLGHGYSPRPDWAGTCPRCGAEAGTNCAVLSVATPALLDVERLARAIHDCSDTFSGTHHPYPSCVDCYYRATRVAAAYEAEGQPVAEDPA